MIRPVVAGGAQVFMGKTYTAMAHGYYRKRRSFLHRDVYEANFGPVPPKHDVHHLDHDPANNQPENLEATPRAGHVRRHWTPERQARALEHIKRMQDLARAWHSTPEGRAWHSAQATEFMKRRAKVDKRCEFCGKPFRTIQTRARFCHQNCKMKFYRREGRVP